MKVLILGATGFVGSKLMAHLSALWPTDGTSRTPVGTLHFFDLADPKSYAVCDSFDVVVNCIVDYAKPFGQQMAQLAASRDFYDHILAQSVHFIEISSVSALPENKYLSEYNFVKHLGEEVLEFASRDKKALLSVLRYAQIIDAVGASRKAQGAFHYFVDAFRNGSPLNIFGNAEKKRSYIPISILVLTVEACIRKRIIGKHNVIMPDAYSANALVAAFRGFVPKEERQLHFFPEKFAAEYHIPEVSESFEAILHGHSCHELFKEALTS